MYCAWRIPAHLRCTQCSILLHLMDICFLTCICLWQISQIQTFLFKVVGPGLVSTSPAFVSSSASHPAGPHGRHGKKTVNRGGSTQFAQQLETTVTAPPLVGCVVWSLTFDFLHSFGNLCVFSIDCIICSNHRRVASPKCLICSQSISSRPAALLFFKALTPCRRSSIKNGDVSFDSVTVCLGIFSLRGTVAI